MKKFITQATDTFKELFLYYGIVIATSSILFSWFEHKKILDSIWWTFVTAMTVGYGDIYPVTIGGRIVGVALMHIVPLVIVPMIVVRMIDSLLENKNEFKHEEQEEIKKGIQEIKNHLQIK